MSQPIDHLTLDAFLALSARFPKHTMRFSHRWADGTLGNACGWVPQDWDGKSSVTVTGQWGLGKHTITVGAAT